VDGELKESREAEKQERGGGGVGDCKSTLILTPMSRPFNFSTSFSTKIKIKTKETKVKKEAALDTGVYSIFLFQNWRWT
jgi:hypothetical protein